MSIAFIFKSVLTVGDHEDYCSDDECVDETSEDYYAFIVKIDDNLSLYERLFYEPWFYERCSGHFNWLFNVLEGDVYTTGSGYCAASPSGLHHEYRLNLTLHKIVRGCEVKLHKYATIIDENDTELPLSVQKGQMEYMSFDRIPKTQQLNPRNPDVQYIINTLINYTKFLIYENLKTKGT